MTNSDAISEAVASAIRDGNNIREISTGWGKMNEVVHMNKPQSQALRAILLADVRLKAWDSTATPHSSAEDGYTDAENKVSISFPKRG
jgi:hypothetical protein